MPPLISGHMIATVCCLLSGYTPAATTTASLASPSSTSQATTASSSTSATANIRDFGELKSRVHAIFEDPSFSEAHWGALIQSLETGETWYERNANRMFMPASNEKIPTAAAGLVTLGPDFTYETKLCHSGTVSGSTLKGNLVVFGNGDPTFYNRLMKEPREVFRKWAGELKARGINRISGDVIGDDNAWDDRHIGSGWAHDGLDSWSGAEYGPLQVNENYVDLTIAAPATTTATVTITPNLPSAYYTIQNHVQVTSSGRTRVNISREPKSNTIIVSGTVTAGSRPMEQSPTITNPTAFYVTVLRETLTSEGITIDGKPVDCDDIAGWSHSPADFTLLSMHKSPPLSEILKGLMKRSQNMYAETMVRTLGWHTTGLGTFDAGREVVQEVLEEFGVKKDSYQFRDGSGLTRYNYIAPRQLVEILRGMRRHKHWETWRDSMPIAGVDGTLRSRMKGTAAEGNVRAKTGTISNVRALSGYLTTADGEELVFSFVVNGHLETSRATERITDDVLALLASYTRNARAADGKPIGAIR